MLLKNQPQYTIFSKNEKNKKDRKIKEKIEKKPKKNKKRKGKEGFPKSFLLQLVFVLFADDFNDRAVQFFFTVNEN